MTASVEERNKALVRRFVDEVQNRLDFSVIEEICDPDQVLDHPTLDHALRGHEALRYKTKELFTGITGNFSIEDIVAEGDQVAVRLCLRGTHTGPMGPVAATGKTLVHPAMTVYRVHDGKLCLARIREDLLGMLDQMGVIPDNPRLLYWAKKTGLVKILQKLGKIPS